MKRLWVVLLLNLPANAVQAQGLGQRVPDFTLLDRNDQDQPVTLSSFQTRAVVLLLVWDSSDPASLAVLEPLRSLIERQPRESVILLTVLNSGHPVPAGKEMERGRLRAPLLDDTVHHSVVASFRIPRVPSLIVIDHQGNLTHRESVPIHYDQVAARLAEALARMATAQRPPELTPTRIDESAPAEVKAQARSALGRAFLRVAELLKRQNQPTERYYERAVIELELGVRLRANDPVLWRGLAQAYEGVGAQPQALMAYRRLVVIKPDDTEVRQAIERLATNPKP